MYRPPPQNDTNCPSDSDIAISTSLESTSNLLRSGKYSGIILMGDFNLPHVEWNEDGAPMLIDVSTKNCLVGNAISNSSLVQMVKEETFFCNEHPISLLDLVLVSDPNRVTNVKRGPPLDGNSSRYHCSLSFQLHSRAARSQAFDSRTLHWRSG
ncbi:hypothetical protein BpHYR1_046060, partial [Brachionus plicatilis]